MRVIRLPTVIGHNGPTEPTIRGSRDKAVALDLPAPGRGSPRRTLRSGRARPHRTGGERRDQRLADGHLREDVRLGIRLRRQLQHCQRRCADHRLDADSFSFRAMKRSRARGAETLPESERPTRRPTPRGTVRWPQGGQRPLGSRPPTPGPSLRRVNARSTGNPAQARPAARQVLVRAGPVRVVPARAGSVRAVLVQAVLAARFPLRSLPRSRRPLTGDRASWARTRS